MLALISTFVNLPTVVSVTFKYSTLKIFENYIVVYPKVTWEAETGPLIAGVDTNMVLGKLMLTNIGTEPAVGNMLTIRIKQDLYRLSSSLQER